MTGGKPEKSLHNAGQINKGILNLTGFPIFFRKESKMKVGDRRPSHHCPLWCDGKGCYDEVQEIIRGKKHLVWIIHCKELEKLTSKAVGKANSIIRRKAGKGVK